MPVAFFLHTRRPQEQHRDFFEFLRRHVQQLSNTPVILVTDREFNLEWAWPQVKHVFCWNHIKQDFTVWLARTKLSIDERNRLLEDFHVLLMQNSSVEFDDFWAELKRGLSTTPT